MTTPAPVRANRDGHQCPPWCEVDHDAAGPAGVRAIHHGTEPPAISFRDGYVTASVYQDGFSDDPPQVWIGSLYGPVTLVDPAQAAVLAALAEMLAGADADQHREFAAQIRNAAETAEADR